MCRSTATTIFRRPHPRRRVPIGVTLLAALLLALAPALLVPRSAVAHAALKESDPAANAILPAAPTRASLRFTEPLERSYSRAELYDQTGNTLPGVSTFGDDRFTMTIDLPSDLLNGTYSILWRTLSEADGHTAQGYEPFTIGTEADVVAVVPPAATADAGGPPEWLRGVARWVALLGLATVVAVWPVWLFVLRPAIAPAWQVGPDLTRRVRRLAGGALLFAALGSVAALLVQAAAVAGGEGLASGVATTLGETRYGTYWLLRLGGFLVFASALMSCAWWWPRRRPAATVATLALAAILPLPFSLISHASAQPAGRATAVAVDALHLLAASVWVGGLFVLVGGLAPTLRQLTPIGRRTVLARAIPRFTALALIAWGVMGLTGLYSAWLQVGNLDGLRETAYGRSLTLKLLLLVPVLGLAAFNLLIVTRRVRRADEAAGGVWTRRFVAAIATEAALVVAVLFVVGRLTGQPPAREALAEGAGRVALAIQADGQLATLYVTPGGAGPNQYRLALGAGHAQHTAGAVQAEAVLRVELPSHDTGLKEIALSPAPGNTYEGTGSELSIAGEWAIEAIVRRPGSADWRATVALPVQSEASVPSLPGEPWRFGPAGIVGLLLVAVGIAGVVLGWRPGGATLRKEAAGLGSAAIVLGGVLLLQARVETGGEDHTALASPNGEAAVVRGAALFAANCVTCHGAAGRGDGPAAAGLNPPPADLTAAHSRTHADVDYAYWIANGIQGSAMPAFGDRLAEADIADAIAYIRDLQGDAAAVADAPGPVECRAAPRTLDGMHALPATPAAAGTGVAARGPTADDLAAGTPADPPTVAGISATMREMAACSNARDIMRRLALFSDGNLRQAFPDGPSAAFANLAAAPATPAPAASWVALLAVRDPRLLADGRATAEIVIDNPTRHTHGPVLPGTPAANGAALQEVARVVFVRSPDGARWLIDEVVQ